ncbi:MAG: hypothetical protein VR65_02490 [Desulfobulbaceae bacterium BRH_c16a]|nr:MAG: hypothetical protein VR65_02490 [Desulfobulbaceae bacterium BRH_c16a]
MTLHVLKIDEGERDLWDQAVITFAHAHPLNAYGWGRVREIDGWKPSYFVAKEGDTVKGMIMVLTKKIPWTGLSIMYAPKGPLCDPSDQNTLNALLTKVRQEGRKKRTIFIRIDPNLAEENVSTGNDPFINEGFIHLEHRWSFWNSPRDVYRIDLTKARNEDELFKTIDHSARKSVRKAQKEGVTIRPAENPGDLKKFYEIFSNVSVEKGFMCRKLKYQEALWSEYIEKGNGQLFLGIYQGEVIGGAICLVFGGKCLGMHMGTASEFMKLQTHSGYVWESLKWAQQLGCSWYSFRGVGTTPAQESFKRKFRPQIVALVGYYDLPFRPLLYRVFYCAEFKVLPMIWRTLMRVRRGYTRFLEAGKTKKLASVRGE